MEPIGIKRLLIEDLSDFIKPYHNVVSLMKSEDELGEYYDVEPKNTKSCGITLYVEKGLDPEVVLYIGDRFKYVFMLEEYNEIRNDLLAQLLAVSNGTVIETTSYFMGARINYSARIYNKNVVLGRCESGLLPIALFRCLSHVLNIKQKKYEPWFQDRNKYEEDLI